MVIFSKDIPEVIVEIHHINLIIWEQKIAAAPIQIGDDVVHADVKILFPHIGDNFLNQIINPENLLKNLLFAPVYCWYIPAGYIKKLAFWIFGKIEHLCPCILVDGLLQQESSKDQFGNIKLNIFLWSVWKYVK